MFGRKRKLRVFILGSGPAGLFAAWGAEQLGHEVTIFSRPGKSALYGAQYLHHEIPGLDCGPMERIYYYLKGTPDDYRRKVYGEGYDGVVSPQSLAGSHNCWDIRRAYDSAWERYADRIQHIDITSKVLFSWRPEADRIIWSIPLRAQCINAAHSFYSVEVWAQGDAPNLGRFCSVSVDPFTVVTNGEESPRWYRAANVYGHRTAEWPFNPKPPIVGLARVVKPIVTNCDCWTSIAGVPVLRVGRYGEWRKGKLSHDAYFDTRRWLR